MYTLLFVLLILDCLVLIAAVLLQAGQGSGLAASFGGAASTAEAVIGSRQAGNLLTRTTWWAGGIFVALSLILGIASARPRAPRSVLDNSFTPTNPAAPASTGPAGAPAGGPTAAPAVPLTPAAPAGAPTNGATRPGAPAGAPRR